MYAEFYGLRELPFQLTPDRRFFFDSAEHRRAMAYLKYGLHHAEGFIVVTGEVGAGKTILLDQLLSQIDRSRFTIARLVTTQLDGDNLLRMIAAEFGFEQEGLSKASLLGRIQEFVLGQAAQGRRAMLIVDEVQNLSFEALEELRMLSNIVVDRASALQSLLVGQPQFRAMLGSRALEQLRQRVTTAYHLRPLNEPDTRAYVEHRLRCAGWKDDPSIAENSFPVVYHHTGGVPRRINALWSRLLLNGFLEKSHAITAPDVEQVGADLDAETAAVSADRSLAPLSEAGAGELARQGARIEALEVGVAKHDRVIRRAIEIATAYLGRDKPS